MASSPPRGGEGHQFDAEIHSSLGRSLELQVCLNVCVCACVSGSGSSFIIPMPRVQVQHPREYILSFPC